MAIKCTHRSVSFEILEFLKNLDYQNSRAVTIRTAPYVSEGYIFYKKENFMIFFYLFRRFSL
jgi:hypothetical protein